MRVPSTMGDLASSSRHEVELEWFASARLLALDQVELMSDKALQTELKVTNTGDSSFDFQAALHSYFSCSDINKVGCFFVPITPEWSKRGPKFRLCGPVG